MSKKEEFKEFVKTKPELINHIKDGSMTWQKFYEIYDIYGNDESAWKTYERSTSVNIPGNIKEITNMIKNIDVESIQKHINTAQKALGVVQELTTKTPPSAPIKGPSSPRPLNKFFGD